MKKLFLLLFISLFFACSNDDDDNGCKCQGKFQRASDTENYFYVNGVDCLTGEPALSQQNAGEIGQTDPAFYLGCNN